MYFHPEKLARVGERIDSVVTLLPQLADEAVAPPVGMYGKILRYSAQLVEPSVTDSRKTLFKGMAAAGDSIVAGLTETIEAYRTTEQDAVDQVNRLMDLINELWS